jgi:hypothetical protein
MSFNFIRMQQTRRLLLACLVLTIYSASDSFAVSQNSHQDDVRYEAYNKLAKKEDCKLVLAKKQTDAQLKQSKQYDSWIAKVKKDRPIRKTLCLLQQCRKDLLDLPIQIAVKLPVFTKALAVLHGDSVIELCVNFCNAMHWMLCAQAIDLKGPKVVQNGKVITIDKNIIKANNDYATRLISNITQIFDELISSNSAAKDLDYRGMQLSENVKCVMNCSLQTLSNLLVAIQAEIYLCFYLNENHDIDSQQYQAITGYGCKIDLINKPYFSSSLFANYWIVTSYFLEYYSDQDTIRFITSQRNNTAILIEELLDPINVDYDDKKIEIQCLYNDYVLTIGYLRDHTHHLKTTSRKRSIEYIKNKIEEYEKNVLINQVVETLNEKLLNAIHYSVSLNLPDERRSNIYMIVNAQRPFEKIQEQCDFYLDYLEFQAESHINNLTCDMNLHIAKLVYDNVASDQEKDMICDDFKNIIKDKANYISVDFSQSFIQLTKCFHDNFSQDFSILYSAFNQESYIPPYSAKQDTQLFHNISPIAQKFYISLISSDLR